MDRHSPIGILDSGVGGLAIAKSLKDNLPLEHVVYYGDTKNFPYGEKKSSEIRVYVKKILKMLVDKDCKLIIIACNSAYSAFKSDCDPFDTVRETDANFVSQVNTFTGSISNVSSCTNKNTSKFYKVENKRVDISILNIVDPMVEYIKKHCKDSNIGVIATERTIKSGIYKKSLCNNVLSFNEESAPTLASIIEKEYNIPGVDEKKNDVYDTKLPNFKNNCSNTKMIDSIKKYLKTPCLNEVDTIILGCTHYYWIKDLIADCWKMLKISKFVDKNSSKIGKKRSHNKGGDGLYCEKKIKILDATDIIILKIKDILAKKNMLNNKPSQDGFIKKDSSTHDNEKKNFKTFSSNFTEKNLHKDIFMSSSKSDNFSDMVKKLFGVKTIVSPI